MNRDKWFHVNFNLLTGELGPVKAGHAHGRQGDVREDMEKGLQFQFWIPGDSGNVRGKEIYLFGVNVGWKHGLIGSLESAFPEVPHIQTKISNELEHLLHDMDNSDDGRHEKDKFIASLFDGKQKHVLLDPLERGGRNALIVVGFTKTTRGRTTFTSSPRCDCLEHLHDSDRV